MTLESYCLPPDLAPKEIIGILLSGVPILQGALHASGLW